jgi:type V secretory pathway adhesin AidA
MIMSDARPSDVYRETGRWFGPVLFAGLAVLAIGLILTVVGWQAHWWFASHDATRQYQLTQNGTSNQDTLRAQITTQLANVATITTQIAAAGSDPAEVSALKPQRAAVAGIACSDAAQITGVPIPAQQAQWVTVNCSDGSVSPGSTLYVTGAP